MKRFHAIAAALAALAAPAHVAAQAYPSKPIRMIIPFPPGGATDITGRYVVQKLGEALGQQGIPENRPGANGTIGLEVAAKAAPDGHTMVLGQTGNLAISPGLTKVGYDPGRDFAPVTLVVSSPHAVSIHPSLPARTLKELVAIARARPGQLNYASTGSGSAGHLGMELLKKATRTDILHVPYKGASPGLTDLVAGHVAMMFTSALSTANFQKSGKVRVLAVGSAQRSASMPDVPTIAESGYPGFEVTSWWGVLVPSATSRDVVARLNVEVGKIMATPDARERIGALGADILTTTPERFAAYIKAEQAKWGQAIRESGARVD
jgi:tripartite-type tricarboxylate transporter receptor subunit TctC